MENNEKTVIGMEFVDEEKQENETTELQRLEEQKPKGPIGKFVDWVTTPVRFVWNKAKKSPVVAGLGGAALGAAGGWGAKVLYDKVTAKKNGGAFIPADPVEVPDDGEVYSEAASFDNTEE